MSRRRKADKKLTKKGQSQDQLEPQQQREDLPTGIHFARGAMAGGVIGAKSFYDYLNKDSEERNPKDLIPIYVMLFIGTLGMLYEMRARKIGVFSDKKVEEVSEYKGPGPKTMRESVAMATVIIARGVGNAVYKVGSGVGNFAKDNLCDAKFGMEFSAKVARNTANSVYENLPSIPKLPNLSRPKLPAVNIFGPSKSDYGTQTEVYTNKKLASSGVIAEINIKPIERKLGNSGIVVKHGIEPIDSPELASTESQTDLDTRDEKIARFEEEIDRMKRNNSGLRRRSSDLQKQNSYLKGRLEEAEMVIKMTDITKSAPPSPDRGQHYVALERHSFYVADHYGGVLGPNGIHYDHLPQMSQAAGSQVLRPDTLARGASVERVTDDGARKNNEGSR